MSRKDDSRARLAGLAKDARTHSNTQASSETAASTQQPRTRPVRMSVDWLPADHRRIRATCTELADETGRVSIPAADLVRAAVELVLDRDELRADLAAALAQQRGSL